MEDAAIVVESAGRSLLDRRPYKVVVDGQQAGQLSPGGEVEIRRDPGAHELFVAIDWQTSPTVELELAAGERAMLRCSPQSNQLAFIYWLTAGRKRAIAIVPVRANHARIRRAALADRALGRYLELLAAGFVLLIGLLALAVGIGGLVNHNGAAARDLVFGFIILVAAARSVRRRNAR